MHEPGPSPELIDLFRHGIDLAIFDFDGVVAETETLHAETYDIVLADKYGVQLAEGYFEHQMLGHPELDLYRVLEAEFEIEIVPMEFRAARFEAYLGLIRSRGVQPNPNAIALAEAAREQGGSAVIVSSQAIEMLDQLIAHWQLGPLFDQVSSAAKPPPRKPELIERAARSVPDPARAALLEDSAHVLRDAAGLGCLRVAFTHPFNADSGIESEADFTLPTL